jgi:hypothetical protein
MYMSIRAVGDDSAWEEYKKEAEGEVNWDDYVKWLKRKGWEYIEPYRYENPGGDLLYEVWRFEYAKLPSKKLFAPRHKENGKWVRGMPPVRVPYKLQELLKRPNEEITLVEGEKGTNAAMKKGILTTCIHGQQWTSEAAAFLTDRTVHVAMDNDLSGRAHIETAREMLKQVNARVRVIELAGLPPGKGLDDWLEDHSVEEYRELVAKTPIEGRISVAPYSFPAEETLALWDWLFGWHLLRGEVSATVGSTGTGKSSKSIAEALSMASGKQLLHDFVPGGGPLHVILVNLEDSRNTIEKRIAAAMRHYSLTPTDIGDRLIVIAKGEIKIQIAKQIRGGDVERNEEDIKKLTTLVLEAKADVISIDSFVRTHAVKENENKHIEAVIECFEEIASKGNCAVHLWHHTRKMNGDQATVESARGAQAFIDTCRSVRVLEKMTKKERDELLGIRPDMKEPGFYFREFNGKRNFAPPADESNWFELVNIKLRNSRSEFEDDGDRVGVVTKWYYPKLELPQVDDTTIGRILTKLRKGNGWRFDHRSEDEPWVGIPIAEVLILNLSDARAKKAVVKIVKDLLRAGHLVKVDGFDKHGHSRPYIEVKPTVEATVGGNDTENE